MAESITFSPPVLFAPIKVSASSVSLAKCIKEIVSSIENGKKILKNEVYHFANYPHCSWYDFSIQIKTIMDKYIKSDTVIEPVNDKFFKQIAEK